MKKKLKENRRRRSVLVTTLVTLTIAAIIGCALGFEKLRSLWREQAIITNMAEQVEIQSGIMVKADVIADFLGLRKGANLALIDFKKKREEILRKVPNLRDIKISHLQLNRVKIEIVEREPIARLGLKGVRHETGKVVDKEGVVFLCQRGTRLLPLIRESANPGSPIGSRLTARSMAALRLLECCREGELRELSVIEVDLAKQDFLTLTLGSTYSRAKIIWQDMDLPQTPASRASLERQLTMLLKAIRSHVGDDAIVWNATDLSSPGKIYADMKGLLQ